MIFYVYCMGIEDVQQEECTRFMCNKKVYSLKDWRNELLRLRKEHAPQYETHPDYIKMTQCKDGIVDKPVCDARRSVPRPAPKPAPKPAPRSAPRTPKPTRKSRAKKQYEAYLEKLKRYEAKVEELQN